MVDDYIKRESVINMLEDAQLISDGEYCGYCTEDISVVSIPAAEAQTIVYSKWINNPHRLGFCICGNCKCEEAECQPFYNIAKLWKFCPNCGARMVGTIKE